MTLLSEMTDAELQAELDRREKKRRELAKPPAPIRLAVQLHDLLCCINHADGCSWYYETGWDIGAKKMWLDRAEACLQAAKNRLFNCTDDFLTDVIIAIIGAIKR